MLELWQLWAIQWRCTLPRKRNVKKKQLKNHDGLGGPSDIVAGQSTLLVLQLRCVGQLVFPATKRCRPRICEITS